MNKFKIVIPSYNNEKWYEPNIASILNQTYTNYEVLYIDDCSTDNTNQLVTEVVGNLPNWKIVRNEKNMRRGYNLSPYNPILQEFMTDDEDILLFVDGDDWLYDDYVLENINRLYQEQDYWMTYGKFICYPSGDIGNPQNTPYPDYIHEHNAYRRDLWRASHLRTFKWHLYNKIKKEDLIFTQTGEFYFHAEDLAVSFPCLEMCPKSRIGVVDFLTYVYNVSQEARDRVENDLSREPNGYKHEVAIREAEVRSRKPYDKLPDDYYITNVLAGGLGNMMFQIAAAYALGREYGHKLLLNPNHVGTLHRPPLAYENSVFQNITVLEKNMDFYKASVDSFSYEEVILPPKNILLDGYFQSPKYFQKYEKEIRELFSFGMPVGYDPKGKVSLHVRRGNYTNLSQHHHNLSIDYYLNAIDYFDGYEFLVFSDDIEWCKKTFTDSKFTFVEGQTDEQDLYLMSLCEHNIIANSTFSWWGAWLNSNLNKIVIYPNKWFGPLNNHFNTYDLFPSEWICLTENNVKMTVNLFDDSFNHLTRTNGRYCSVHGKISEHIKYDRGNVNYEGITIFTDQYLNSSAAKNVISNYKVGWLLETREIDTNRYNNFEQYKDNFDFVMTHDQELLDKYPDKTQFTIFGGTWISTNNYGLHRKTKNVSMIFSHKIQLTGHKLRHEVAYTVPGIDLYGRGTTKPIEYKEEALLEYRYSVVIENSKTDNYFTEKLVDALIVGTVPIYWGCPNIEAFFDTRGFIIVNDVDEIREAVANLTEDQYILMLPYIEANIELAKKYAVTEDWMYENIFKDLK